MKISPYSNRITINVNSFFADVVMVFSEKPSGCINDNDWDNLFASESYKILVERNKMLKINLTDTDFKDCVMKLLSEENLQRYKNVLQTVKSIDLQACAGRALKYLPVNATIFTTVHLVVLPQPNYFIYCTKTTSAVFISLSVGLPLDDIENILVHELHHIGFLSIELQNNYYSGFATSHMYALRLLGYFREGIALLAAAGSAHNHPIPSSNPDLRLLWDNSINDSINAHKKIEDIFNEIFKGNITHEELDAKSLSFCHILGPWYTLGWLMAVTVECQFGINKLNECMQDLRLLLLYYNYAVELNSVHFNSKYPLWSTDLLKHLMYG